MAPPITHHKTVAPDDCHHSDTAADLLDQLNPVSSMSSDSGFTCADVRWQSLTEQSAQPGLGFNRQGRTHSGRRSNQVHSRGAHHHPHARPEEHPEPTRSCAPAPWLLQFPGCGMPQENVRTAHISRASLEALKSLSGAHTALARHTDECRKTTVSHIPNPSN